MQPSSKTIYIVTHEPEPEWEDEINRWYDEEHIPALLGLPGYLSARRYVAVDGTPKYMQFYQIASIDAFRSPKRAKAIDTPWAERLRPHRTSKLTIYEQIFPEQGELHGAAWGEHEGGFLVNRADAAPEMEQDFNDWYNQEHLPALAAVPGTIAVRRFRAIEGEPKYMAIYHLTEPGIQVSADWKKAIDTPWSARVRGAFRNRWRTVYKPLA